MTKDKNNLLICNNFYDAIKSLSNENAGILFKTIFQYHLTGEYIEHNDIVNFAFLTIKDLIDENRNKYQQKCEKNRENIKKYWDNKRTNTNEYECKQLGSNIKENKIKENKIKENKIKENNLYIPTKKEIEDYSNMLAKKINIDDFMAYYEASNWCDDNCLPINWKQKVISWANRNKVEEPKKRVCDGLF